MDDVSRELTKKSENEIKEKIERSEIKSIEELLSAYTWECFLNERKRLLTSKVGQFYKINVKEEYPDAQLDEKTLYAAIEISVKWGFIKGVVIECQVRKEQIDTLDWNTIRDKAVEIYSSVVWECEITVDSMIDYMIDNETLSLEELEIQCQEAWEDKKNDPSGYPEIYRLYHS